MLFTGYSEFVYLLVCRNKMILFTGYSEFVYLLDCRNENDVIYWVKWICIFTRL